MFSVNDREASVTCTSESLFINYTSKSAWARVSSCLDSSVLCEDVPYSEILSAEMFISQDRNWLHFADRVDIYGIDVYTFVRSNRMRSIWAPRVITVRSPDRAQIEQCLVNIQQQIRQCKNRPENLLVLINPYGGSKNAATVYERDVKPVFERAGIKTTVRTTRYSGDAKETICSMLVGKRDTINDINDVSTLDLDGIVAVGGDGLFHEVVAGILETGMESRIRVAHVAAGSTDAVACTINGTRSAFTAAVHIAIGDSVPLDVLRIDSLNSSGDSTKFALSMASYGFFGNVMQESEKIRWMGPMRYDVVGARMWLLNRSYRARVEYLPAPPEPSDRQIVCTKDCPVCSQPSHDRLNTAHRSFRLHAQSSRARFASDWRVIEGNFAGIMLVIMPCRSDKSKAGVCKYSHLSDGRIHLVMIKACSRWQYLKFLLKLSTQGIEECESEYIDVVHTVAVNIQHQEPCKKMAFWNVDGELLELEGTASLFAETHRAVISAFSRGVEE
jgi:ceramide kinase